MITVIAWFVVGLTVVQFLLALTNIIFRPWLPGQVPRDEPMVSVLIPARNEEKNIGNILRDLTIQPYRNIEVLVFNDQSSDQTAAIVTGSARGDSRIRLIDSPGLPEGWLGKNYGCYCLAKQASGSYLLFLDADVRISGEIIGNAVTYARKYGTVLISIFPQQVMVSAGEKFTVPVMNYILVSLLPLFLVRVSRRPSLAAANGQFMFFRKDIYRSVDPHFVLKHHPVEDIAIARLLKQQGTVISCLLGDERIRCRMYGSFNEAVRGFSKNVTAFFGNSFIVALLFWFFTSWGFLLVFFCLPLSVFLVYCCVYLATRVIISLVSKQNAAENVICIFPQQLSMGLFIFKAWQNRLNKEYIWKGRKFS